MTKKKLILSLMLSVFALGVIDGKGDKPKSPCPAEKKEQCDKAKKEGCGGCKEKGKNGKSDT